MKKTLLFSIAFAGAFNFVASAEVDHVVYSPKAKQQMDSLKTVPGSTTDMVDRSTEPGSPKSRELADSMRRVLIVNPGLDLTAAPRPVLAPKDPRYETALIQNAQREVYVAPLK